MGSCLHFSALVLSSLGMGMIMPLFPDFQSLVVKVMGVRSIGMPFCMLFTFSLVYCLVYKWVYNLVRALISVVV